MQTNKEPNIWRTMVLVAVGLFVALFLWTFLWNSSNDMKGFVTGIGFGILAGYAFGWLSGLHRSGAPARHAEQVNDAYSQGYSDGNAAKHRAAIAQRNDVAEVVVPQQARELVPVRR